jgi:uncharacterized Zn finger protein
MSWWHYSDQSARKAAVKLAILKRKTNGEAFVPLQAPKGNKLSRTFWGEAWCRNLEAYADYAYRLPRGRSYLRQGNVYNLKIEKGELRAQVAGSELYDVRIDIRPLAKIEWRVITEQCAGHVGSLLDLLAGKLGDDVMCVLTDRERGLFPKPREMRFNCSCPDWADMCKHVASVLYGVGVLLDTAPELFFVLRGVDQEDLIAAASTATLAPGDATGDLAGADLSTLFGIDLSDGGPIAMPAVSEAPEAAARVIKNAARQNKAVGKTAAKRGLVAKKKPSRKSTTKRGRS